MTLRLTREQRRVQRIIDKLKKEGVPDEHKGIAWYRNRARDFEAVGYYEEAEIMKLIQYTEQQHKDILNEMILNLKEKVIWKEYLKE